MNDQEIVDVMNHLRKVDFETVRQIVIAFGNLNAEIANLRTEAAEWEETAGHTAVMRDDFARALVEIEAQANLLKKLLDAGRLNDPTLRTMIDLILAACTGSIGKTASPTDTVSELDRANTGLAQESLDLQTALAQIEKALERFQIPDTGEDQFL